MPYKSLQVQTITYDGNRLLNVDDYLNDYNQLFTGGQDFKNNEAYPASYTYDSIGNMTSNLDKKIATIKYNYLNLPDTIQMQNGCMTAYDYDLSTGEKITANSRVFIGSTITMPVGQTLYNNNVGFEENAFNQNYVDSYYDNIVYKTGVQKKILTSDGMLMNTGTSSSPVYNRHYFLKDHLGNIRVVFDQNGIVKQVSNYYPFGMEYGESAEDQTEMTFQDYQFGGKEFERDFEVNLYDFGARDYDATVGRWTRMDPLAEQFPWQSPYAYCSNSPVSRIDPTGMADTPSSKDEWEKYYQAMAAEFDHQVSQTTGNSTTKTPYRSSTTTTSSNTKNNTKKNTKEKVSKGSVGGWSISGLALLADLYLHNQYGEQDEYDIIASTLDFSGTSQRQLKLTGMKKGDFKTISLFNSGINPNSLAFGSLIMTYQDNNQFSITSNKFDFDWNPNESFTRNAGTFIGGAVFGQFYTTPITPFSILRDVTKFGGSFYINFIGTVTIPK